MVLLLAAGPAMAQNNSQNWWEFWGAVQNAPSIADLPAANNIPAPTLYPAPASKTPFKIGLLLPLSGPQAALGQELQNAAMMAVFANLPYPVALLPRDTGGTAAGAANAYATALADGAEIILGPVFSLELQGLRGRPRAEVPIWSFSNDWQQAGGGIFLLGQTPQAEIPQSLRQIEKNGARLLHILAADTAYGQAAIAAVREFSAQHALKILNVFTYAPQNPAALREAVEKLRRALPQSSPAAQSYQAVLVVESPARLAALDAALVGDWPQHVVWLGLGNWPDEANNYPQLAKTLVPKYDPARRQVFLRQYQDYFQNPPGPLAMIAYQAVQAISQSAQAGQGNIHAMQNLWQSGQSLDTEFGPVNFRDFLWQTDQPLRPWAQFR